MTQPADEAEKTATPSPQRPITTRRAFWGAFGALMALTSAWALASPLAAGPDENAHIIKAAAVVRGELTGTSAPDNPGSGIVQVPRLYAELTVYPACFAFHGETPASCVPQLAQGAEAAKPVDAGTWVVRNNPMYYAFVGLPTLLPAGEYVVYLMRLLSAALCSLVLAWGVRAVAEITHRALPVVSTVAALTPMVIFLNSTVNPSSLEISAAVALWLSLLVLVRSPDPERLPVRAAGIAIVAVLLANARGLSPVYVAVIAVTVTLVVGPWSAFVSVLTDRRSWLWLGVVVAGVVASLAWTASAGTLQAGGTGHAELGFLTTANRTFFDTGDFLIASIGRFGWVDTNLPTLTTLVFVALIGLPTLLALSLGRRRDRWAMLAVVGIVVMFPVVVHAWQARNVGYIWTARYSIPLTVGVVLVAGFVSRDGLRDLPGWVGDRLLTTITALLAGGQLIAFAVNLRRYVVGETGSWRQLFSGEWTPPINGSILLLAATASLVVGVLLAVRLGRSGTDPELDESRLDAPARVSAS
ncbi:DUF2142 domain-containing protein [Cellulomonas sp. URHE0023]|uniref:DUF2142 domain-containing protein n=1 Tax=Cellulomonas sp. URHE0023 TaxID=1380354 RepID=UPI0018CC10F3|nr:DUF2142 domain-containing protein [Cellulomonas sp. URHE0023]